MCGAAAEIAAPPTWVDQSIIIGTNATRGGFQKKEKGLFAVNLSFFYDYSAHVLLNVKMGRQIICVCLSASTSPGVKPKVVESKTMFAEGRGSNNPAKASANPMNSSICSIPT